MDSEAVIFSFFSGSGFLDLGFEKSGFQIDLVNEFSPAFIKAYKYSRAKMGLPLPKYGYQNVDINEYLTVRKEEIKSYVAGARKNKKLIGFIGGPPCPDFSVGGKNRGRDGENGKLSLSYINLICALKPDFFLFENVKGLWRTTRHRAFYEELKTILHQSGYATTERLTNSIEFGVPQDRERILLFGVQKKLLKDTSVDKSILINFPWDSHIKYDMADIKQTIWMTVNTFEEDSYLDPALKILKELTVQYWFDNNNVVAHPNALDYFKPRNGLSKMQSIDEGDVSKKSYKRLHRWRYSPTAAYGNNEVHLHPYKARRLSAAEALAIQTLPSDFELPSDMSLSDMFKTIGNGVPFLLSKAIATTIKEYIAISLRDCDEMKPAILG